MSTTYLVIKVGFEGIDKLVWLTHDKETAIDKRQRAINIDIAESNNRSRKTKFERTWTDDEISNRY